MKSEVLPTCRVHKVPWRPFLQHVLAEAEEDGGMLHTPEVVLCIPRQDVVFRDTLVKPILLRFKIGLQSVGGVAFKVCDV